MKLLSMNEINEEFPILNRKINGKRMVYLDSAATSQKPLQVIKAIEDYYRNYNANVHRGIYQLSVEATEAYESAHDEVASLINANPEEIIFTRGTTESLNLVAYSLGNKIKDGEILLSKMEHHSNLVPWQQLAKRNNLKLKFFNLTENGELDLSNINELINKNTKIVSLTQVSNVLGTINPVKEIAKIAHDSNALFVADSAQGVPHMEVNVKNLDVDFLAFSGHKMLAPTGIGALYGKKEILEEMDPFMFGGDMIREVKLNESTWNTLPWKFEAGTPNISGGIGFGAAVKYIKKIGIDNIENHEKNIVKYAYDKLNEMDNVEIYGPEKRSGLISFNLKGIHAHDVSSILDESGIAIRGGHHCCMPLMEHLGIAGNARASFYIYNNEEDVDILVKGLEEVKRIFKWQMKFTWKI